MSQASGKLTSSSHSLHRYKGNHMQSKCLICCVFIVGFDCPANADGHKVTAYNNGNRDNNSGSLEFNFIISQQQQQPQHQYIQTTSYIENEWVFAFAQLLTAKPYIYMYNDLIIYFGYWKNLPRADCCGVAWHIYDEHISRTYIMMYIWSVVGWSASWNNHVKMRHTQRNDEMIVRFVWGCQVLCDWLVRSIKY